MSAARLLAVEPELQPYFRIEPDTDEVFAPPSNEVTFHCKSCALGWAYEFDRSAANPDAKFLTLILDMESRNALLAHARSHRAPRLRLITQ